jgi:hypothetical protein
MDNSTSHQPTFQDNKGKENRNFQKKRLKKRTLGQIFTRGLGFIV